MIGGVDFRTQFSVVVARRKDAAKIHSNFRVRNVIN